jgi:hypothetical protein
LEEVEEEEEGREDEEEDAGCGARCTFIALPAAAGPLGSPSAEDRRNGARSCGAEAETLIVSGTTEDADEAVGVESDEAAAPMLFGMLGAPVLPVRSLFVAAAAPPL